MLALGPGRRAGRPAAAALEAAVRAQLEAARSRAGGQPQGAARRHGGRGRHHGLTRLKATAPPLGRWTVSGNEAAGYGALRGGVRFVAAYPITPATELLDGWRPR